MAKQSKRRGGGGASSSSSSLPSSKNGNNNNNTTKTNTDDEQQLYDDGVVVPPVECTPSELTDLRSQAAALSWPDEARTELLECARYGEVDAVRAILDFAHAHRHDAKPVTGTGTGAAADDDDDSAPSSAAAKGGSDGHGDAAANKGGGDGDRPPPLVDTPDASTGSTPLHRAAANGHASTVLLLLKRGARHVPNTSGNTPLHWAAANGHPDVVKIIIEEVGKTDVKEEIDVLTKNEFGRSALTEGFAGNNTEVVKMLLEHDSADEEKLLMGGKEIKADGTDGEGADTTINDASSVDTAGTAGACVVHEFDFRSVNEEDEAEKKEAEGTTTNPPVLIRELPIAHADDPFGAAPAEDTTGLGIWCASLVMARWVSSPEIIAKLADKRVVELGAGCGVPGLAAAVYGTPRRVALTDLNPATIQNLDHNVGLNDPDSRSKKTGTGQGGEEASDSGKTEEAGDDANGGPTMNTPPWSERITASSIDWDDPSTYPMSSTTSVGAPDDAMLDEDAGAKPAFDIVLGSDLVYQAAVAPYLLKAVCGLLPSVGGTFLYVAPDTGRDGLDDFLASLEGAGFERAVEQRIAPDEYRSNPLKNGDEEECFLHFHELSSSTYVLHEFVRRR